MKLRSYDANMGSGNVKRAKIEGRLSAITNAFKEYFHLDEGHILSEEEIEELLKKHEANEEALSPDASETYGDENSEECIKFGVGLISPVEDMECTDEDSPVMEEVVQDGNTELSDES